MTLPPSTWRDLLLWLLRRRRRVRVVNRSMVPLLQPDDEVLVDYAAYRTRPPQVGDIVVARHPQHPELKIIKVVDAVLSDGRVFLVGLNGAESADSRHFGAVPPSLLLGRVTSRF